MNRIKKVFILIHITLWILFSLLVGMQLYSEAHPYWRTLTAGYTLTCAYVFYAHFYILTEYFSKKNKSAYWLLFAVVLLTGPIPLLLIYANKLETWDNILESYRVHLFSCLIFIFLSWLARVIENLVLNTIRKEQLEKQAVETELSYLKSQINPHFLFNTLNNIHTLVYKQAPAAPEAVLRLSSLMRYMIYESNAHTVPLSRELTYLNDFISLQQLRYKNPGVVDLQLAGEISNCYIPPLLFIHFLENAYKHSPAGLNAGDIRMKAEVKENTFIFSIQNPVAKKHGSALDEPGGIGLPNIRKRLALLYPEKHTLEINNSGEVFTVTVTIYDLSSHIHERKADLLYH